MVERLRTTFTGVEFPNPFLLGSAPPTRTADMMKRALEAGWGGVVTKTIGLQGATNVRPRFAFWKDDDRIMGMTNFELISDKGLDHWVDQIADVKAAFPDRRVVASIMGSTEFVEWEILARAVEAAGADAVELNISCPHGMPEQHMGAFMGQDPGLIRGATAAAVAGTSLPVWVKLTPNVTDIAQMALAAQQAGAHALTAINTVAGLMGIDIDTFQPLPSVANRGAYGGYSGRGIKPIALRAVSATAAATGLPVSATGGIATWQDAAEFLLAGASTFQVCTEVMARGLLIIDDLIDGLATYLESKGFENLDAARGKALPHIGDFGALDARAPARAEVDPYACTSCGSCEVACTDGGFQAISLNDAAAHVDPGACDGCGLCQAVCDYSAIAMVRA